MATRIRKKEVDSSSFYYSGYRGHYTLSGDTIKTKYIRYPPIFRKWIAFEIWYKIIDRNTLHYITSFNLHFTTVDERKRFQKAEEKRRREYLPAVFVPLEVLPGSNCWLSKKKWFHCKE